MEILDTNSPQLRDLFQSLEKIESQMSTLVLGLAKKQWLTPNEVCAYLEISRRTLQRYRDERGLPHARIDGKTFYSKDEIEKFIQQKG